MGRADGGAHRHRHRHRYRHHAAAVAHGVKLWLCDKGASAINQSGHGPLMETSADLRQHLAMAPMSAAFLISGRWVRLRHVAANWSPGMGSVVHVS